MKLLNLEQNKDQWLVWRNKGIGASDATIIMGRSPWMNRKQLKERKLSAARKKGHKEEADNGAMRRGRALEPVARSLYEGLTGIKSNPVCVIHDHLAWMRASLDGLSVDGLIPLEIKCVNAEDHQTALSGKVPHKYYPQVQHQLYVTGCQFLHYFSYTDKPNFEARDRAALVEVFSDPDFQAELIEEERKFWTELTESLPDPSWLHE